MALCVSEPTRLPLHTSRGMGGGARVRSGGGADQFNISGASDREAAHQAAFLPAAIIWGLFLDPARVRYFMRPCKPRGGGERVNPPNLDRS